MFFLDPPGAPSTYSSNYPILQNDPTNPSWSSHHDINNQFYQINSHSMPQSNLSYDPNQYNHTTSRGSGSMNQSQQIVSEERPSKKVQFAPTTRQAPLSKAPLSGTQSWHDIPGTNNDTSVLIPRQDTLISRQSMHRPAASVTNVSSTQPTVEKPIYVGIDHRATLAERGQRTAHKRQHTTNTDKTNAEGSNANTGSHRTRSHGHHQHKHPESIDSSATRSGAQLTRSSDGGTQGRSSTHHSSGSSIPTRTGQNTEQLTMSDNEMKTSRKRHSRRQHAQAMEQASVTDNEVKSSRQRSSHSQQQQKQQSNQPTHRSGSPLRVDAPRRPESKQETAPLVRAQSPQQRSHQRQRQTGTAVVPPPIATNSITVTRARV